MTNQDIKDFGSILKAYRFSVRNMTENDFGEGEMLFIAGHPGIYSVVYDYEKCCLFITDHEGEIFGYLSFVFESIYIRNPARKTELRFTINEFYLLTQNP